MVPWSAMEGIAPRTMEPSMVPSCAELCGNPRVSFRSTVPVPFICRSIAAAAVMDLQMKGTGTVDLNETRGFPQSSAQEGTIDGSIVLGAMPSIALHGTIKTTASVQ